MWGPTLKVEIERRPRHNIKSSAKASRVNELRSSEREDTGTGICRKNPGRILDCATHHYVFVFVTRKSVRTREVIILSIESRYPQDRPD